MTKNNDFCTLCWNIDLDIWLEKFLNQKIENSWQQKIWNVKKIEDFCNLNRNSIQKIKKLMTFTLFIEMLTRMSI